MTQPFANDIHFLNTADSSNTELNESIQRLALLHEERTDMAQPFYDTLEWACKRIDYRPPTSGITYVLAINSGFGHDVIALNSYFGSQPNGIANEATHVYNIERSTPQHEAAQQHNSRVRFNIKRSASSVEQISQVDDINQAFVLEPPEYFHFLNSDPAVLPSLPLPAEFHAIILRHLDASNPSYPYETILHNALDVLAPDGIAIITTFNNTLEHIPLRQFLMNPNYEVLLSDQNPHAQLIAETIVELDAIVTVVRKADNYETPAAPALPTGYSPGIVDHVITREVFAFPSQFYETP